MKTDRELLTLAAKAAGIEYDKQITEKQYRFGLWLIIHGEPYGGQRRSWNPLTDGGDAFRLAVKLKIDVKPYYVYEAPWDNGGTLRDPYAATRLAIVRTAAAIGEQMK